MGLSWQKDAGWGDYFVTTLTDYGETVNLNNAMTYSDNIYFAREALKLGADIMAEKLRTFGFEEEMPFDLTMQKSTFDEDGKIDSEIQLADTGYGQGQTLVNPLHLLSMYSMFVNGGNMIQPVLRQEEAKRGNVLERTGHYGADGTDCQTESSICDRNSRWNRSRCEDRWSDDAW